MNVLLGGALLLSAPLFTSCQDILGEWERPTPASGGSGGSSAAEGTYIVYTAPGTSSNVAIPSTATAWNFTSGDVPAGTYYVEGSFTSTGALVLQGEVNLILKDGATLTVDNGIGYTGTGSLNIYAQSEGTGMGHLVVNYETPAADSEIPAIKVNNMTIHGGQIEATAYSGATTTICNYGVEIFGDLTIYAGNVTATGKKSGYGICMAGASSAMVLNGGTVTVLGGDDTSGFSGAGIYSGGDITINGGTLSVTGGASTANPGGVGIQANIIVTDCIMVTATGGTGFSQGDGLSTFKTMNIATSLKYSIDGGAATVGTGAAVTPAANNALVIEPNT